MRVFTAKFPQLRISADIDLRYPGISAEKIPEIFKGLNVQFGNGVLITVELAQFREIRH